METSEKTYKFARPKLTEINGNKVDMEYSWMLVLETVDDLIDYTELYQDATIKEGLQEILTKDYTFHNRTQWGHVVETLSSIKEESFLITSHKLENEVFNTKLELIMDYGRVYVNEHGGCFPHTKNYIVLEETTKKGLSWPTSKLTIEDANIMMWPNGTHWYVKFGRMDVVVDGQQKWDTYDEARNAAIEYLKREQE